MIYYDVSELISPDRNIFNGLHRRFSINSINLFFWWPQILLLEQSEKKVKFYFKIHLILIDLQFLSFVFINSQRNNSLVTRKLHFIIVLQSSTRWWIFHVDFIKFFNTKEKEKWWKVVTCNRRKLMKLNSRNDTSYAHMLIHVTAWALFLQFISLAMMIWHKWNAVIKVECVKNDFFLRNILRLSKNKFNDDVRNSRE